MCKFVRYVKCAISLRVTLSSREFISHHFKNIDLSLCEGVSKKHIAYKPQVGINDKPYFVFTLEKRRVSVVKKKDKKISQ